MKVHETARVPQAASFPLSHPGTLPHSGKLLALAIAATVLSVPALAQDRERGGNDIEEIVVTSSRVPVPLRQFGDDLQQAR